MYTEYDLEYPSGENFNEEKERAQPPLFVPPYESDPLEGIPIDQYGGRRCDRKVNLYTLQPDKLNNNPLKGKLTNCHNSGCERYQPLDYCMFYFTKFESFPDHLVYKGSLIVT